jgi:hypothetical protein
MVGKFRRVKGHRAMPALHKALENVVRGDHLESTVTLHENGRRNRFLRTPQPNLSRGMQNLASGYANWYAKRHRRPDRSPAPSRELTQMLRAMRRVPALAGPARPRPCPGTCPPRSCRVVRAKSAAGTGASGAGASRTAHYLNSGCLATRPMAEIVR